MNGIENRQEAASGTAVVIGVGAKMGLGSALARRFASEGMPVLIAARNKERLELAAEDIRQLGGTVEIGVADATSEADMARVMAQAEKMPGGLRLVAFNAGNNFRKDILDLSAQEMEDVWRVCCLGGFIAGREAARIMAPKGEGTILFTGATASTRARPPFTAFASAKFALRAVVQAMARDFGPKGVHVAHAIIDGVIHGEKILSRAPEFAKQLGVEGMLDVDAIADAYWHLHTQKRSAWTAEIDLRPNIEAF